jgi:hypothetical protein
LCILFGLSKFTISDVVNRKQQLENGSNRDENAEELFSSNRQIRPHFEEEVFLEWIHQQHCNQNCQPPHDVRIHAQSLFQKRTGQEITCTGDWWKSFERGHANCLETQCCTAIESATTAIGTEAVLRHFAPLVQVLSSLKTAEQLSNVDETGNGSRPDKERVPRAICSKQATVEAHF